MKHNVLTTLWQRYRTSPPIYNQKLTFLQRHVPAGDEVLTKIQSSRVCCFTKIVSFRVFARDLTITSRAVHCFKKYPYSEFFWSKFSGIRTEYGEIRSISTYSVRIRENADQKNSEYRHFSGSENFVTHFYR